MTTACKGGIHQWIWVAGIDDVDPCPPAGMRCDCGLFMSRGGVESPVRTTPRTEDCCYCCDRPIEDHPYVDCARF